MRAVGRLDGRTALVTGAGRGIGQSVARRLAADGAQVVINYSRAEAQAEALAKEINAAGGKALTVAADLGNLTAIENMFSDLRRRVGHLDILVNNAGRGAQGAGGLTATTPKTFDAVFAVNTRGLFFVTKAAVEMMLDGGRVINISSLSTRARVSGISTYAGGKAAVEAFTRGWSAELAPRKITVNTVVPGIVDTDLIGDWSEERKAERVALVPLGRIGHPTDVAAAVAFLAGDDAEWITGAEILVSGGN
jgi:3-oxoacyl-[acyl-carrier protein] reductase